jgi:hypothetical protein
MRTVAAEALSGKICELVAISRDDLGPNMPLVEFSVDSLVGIEIKN